MYLFSYCFVLKCFCEQCLLFLEAYLGSNLPSLLNVIVFSAIMDSHNGLF